MKNIVFILAGSLISAATVHIIHSNDVNQLPIREAVHVRDNINQLSYISALSDKIKNYENANEERMKKSQSSQEKIHKTISDIALRLSVIEENINNRLTDNTHEKNGEGAVEKHQEGKSSEVVSEVTLSQWMDNTMEVEFWDDIATEQASMEVSDSLSKKLPGVHLDEIQCGEGFCRASLAQASGEYPNISSLMGMPPFVSEGFTMKGNDGKLLVYFTEPGVSIDDLRNRADETKIN